MKKKEISALDENGKQVDWWFMYKVPQLSHGANNDSATGYEYVYYDPKQPRVAKSPYLINEGKGALNLTLKSVFQNPAATTGWILYNDEMPENAKAKDNGNLGHTKGVIAFDTASKTALWLLHSWPKFSDPKAAEDPTPKYGQTYMCLTIDLDTACQLATQMAQHQEPQTYLCRTANLEETNSICVLSRPLSPAPKGDSDVLDAKTRGGMPFKVIAKNREWNKDFWNELVGPTLGVDMDVETWIRGPIPPIADSDGIHKTFDLKYINMGPLGARWAWPETHDHAKWGISVQKHWVCVGDINRMISQRKRGGGAIAIENEVLWKALSKTSLVLAPPGHSREHAVSHFIQNTHGPEAPPRAKPAPKKKPAAKATKAKATKAKGHKGTAA